MEPGAGRPYDGGEAGRRAGEGSGLRVRGRELPHEELPCGGPAVADGEDELRRGQRAPPQQVGEGGEGIL